MLNCKKLFLLIILLLIVSCAKNNSLQTITVSTQANVNTLYLDSIIEPLKVYNVDAPIDGTIVQKNFEFGDNVKQGQILLVLKSQQLADDYQTALTDYLKAKRDFSTNQSQMAGTEYLKKMGIISEQEYQTSVSTNYDLNIAYNQAAEKLQNLLIKMGKSNDLSKLNADPKQTLNQNFNTLNITAPHDGVALTPVKSGAQTSTDDATTLLPIGSQIKTADNLLLIGDMTGISVAVKINESHINEIKDGQEAMITSDAFPGTLTGYVNCVVQEACSGDNTSAPNFPIKIIVPHLTDAQRKIIHVGMSAKVQLNISSTPAIKIPISAVMNQDGATTVKILDAKTAKPKVIPVTTGTTTLDSVEITNGLKDGDKVLINP